MTVYSEYLFLENFIAGMLLLWMTGRMTESGTESAKPGRILAGSVLSGMGGFLIFMPFGTAAGFFTRGLLAVLITAIGLGTGSPDSSIRIRLRRLLQKTAVFLAVSLLSGGTVMAIFLWTNTPALSANGSFYTEPMTYTVLILCTMPAMGLSLWFVKKIRGQGRERITTGTVTIRIDEKIWAMEALIDTGNCLREPLTGKPVILTDRKGKRQMEERGMNLQNLAHRTAVIPYSAVGVEHGILKGVRLDEVDFAGKRMQGSVLAFYEGDFDGFEILLNRELLEGGVLDNV